MRNRLSLRNKSIALQVCYDILKIGESG